MRFSTIGFFLAISSAAAFASTFTGTISVYDGNNLLGYVSRIYDGQNSFTYTSNIANALTITFDNASTAPFAIALSAPILGNANNSYFGAVGGSGGFNFTSGALGYAYLSGTSLTAAGALPSLPATSDIEALGYNGPVESTIWSLTAGGHLGGVLNPQWVNANGTVSIASTFYDGAVDFLGIVGDFNKFTSTFPGENAKLVSFEVSAIPTPEPGSVVMGVMGLGMIAVLGLRKRG